MQTKIRLANGYTFNRVINGCWQLSAEHNLTGTTDLKDALRGFHELVAQGFTTFDCADIYTGVEELIGRFVQELKGSGHYQEEDIQIHTKFVPDKSQLAHVDRTYVERIIDRSLQRMHREVIDLVQFHWWDFNVAGMMDTAFELVRLQEKGKIRNIGMCNMDTERLKQMVDAGINVVSNQAQYSLLDRRPEKTLLKYSADHGIYTFAYGTLAGGFLTERYMGQSLGAPETRSQVKYLQILEDSLGWEGLQKLLPVLKKIAQSHQVSVSNVVTQYILNQPGVGAVMIGTRSSRHIDDNVRTLQFQLTPTEMAMIRNFISQYSTPTGECYELERTSPRYQSIILTDLDD
ncbi:aldo/keto reductase [Limosilactobacillus ingluviei]|uniref:aldo/keto reductase n=1 Tax=Limosilactobacillus ingluviei TaxID=148604 RepID=UPI0023F1C49A|nr:aldo/keto reductase [Limosilactobacillus ingluviei]